MYNHKEIEKKWQNYWEQSQTFRTYNPDEILPDGRKASELSKFYVLDMFPYPSGAGLHVGHPEGYTANDIVARYKHACGFNVLHPMGWDAFGLPAENYAVKTGVHPRITTEQNIATFKRQIQSLGFSYDWNREIDTTDPEYYKWTQWIFLKLFEHGLAYEQDLPVNWCPALKAVLANEEVVNGRSEIGDHPVERKKLRQWVLGITKYIEDAYDKNGNLIRKGLLNGVDNLDWPEGIKDMQRNWIGKSEGCEFEMKKAGDDSTSIRVYTTRIDTVFGVTYAVIAPDHPEVAKFITDSERQACEQYIQNVVNESDQERTADNKEKTGVFTGSYVVNPYNGEEVPLWIADYVLGNYGTGAVMAVPAHDERDFEFAKKYGLEIRQSVAIEIIGKGVIAPQEGKTLREKTFINAIIEYNGKILVLKEQAGSKFVGGGLEENETYLEGVLREIEEETGFMDLGEIKQIPNTAFYGYAYRPGKDRNDKGLDTPFFHVKLNSLKTQGISEEEASIHELTWLDFSEVGDSLMSNGHKHAWDYFLNQRAFTDYGKLVNSGKYDGLTSQEAKEAFIELAKKEGFGMRKVNYKLRDWLFSRQRYWGEPIPLIHLEIHDVEKLPTVPSIDAWVKNGDTLMIGEKEFSKIYDGLYTKIVCDYSLPLKLPPVEKYEPSSDGQSPLANIDEFVNVELAANLSGKRETNTMPQWGGSCWYYLRFMDAKNREELVGSEVEKYWGSVDSYVGGAEHAVLHLLYARFWHKFLYDIGVVSTTEPFQRLRNQGMILGMSYKTSDGRLIASDLVREEGGKFFHTETGDELQKIPAKMSKSLKNVINPDEIVELHGADTLRLYEMYMGDFADSKPWDTTAIIGCRRFLEKVYRAFEIKKGGYGIDDFDTESEFKNDKESLKVLHKSIKKITEDIENYKFNTAIAQLMILIKHIPNIKGPNSIWLDFRRKFLILLHPFAPHIAEELWSQELVEKKESRDDIKEFSCQAQAFSEIFGLSQTSIFFTKWPSYDEALTVDSEVTIGVQVLGKLRGEIQISVDEDKDSVLSKAKSNPDVMKWLEDKEIVKEIYVPGKIVNIVVK